MDRNDGMFDRAEALIDSLGEPLMRGEILNTLPREQMEGLKWHLLYERDGGACYICGGHVGKGFGEVDHVMPRSSFPPEQIQIADRSDNLRTTHVECNQSKSNFVLEEMPRTVGITARCWECTYDKDVDPDHDPEAFSLHREEYPRPAMTVTAYCGRCGFTWVPDETWLM